METKGNGTIGRPKVIQENGATSNLKKLKMAEGKTQRKKII